MNTFSRRTLHTTSDSSVIGIGSNPAAEEIIRIVSLADQARDNALHMMCTAASVLPTVMADMTPAR